MVAFEAAHILRGLNFNVKGVVLIDSPYPKNHEPLPEKIIRYVLSHSSSGNGVKNRGDSIGKSSPLLLEFKANAALLGAYSPPQPCHGIKTVILRSRDTFDTSALCGVKYDWLTSQSARTKAIKGWESLIGEGVDVLDIPGHHFQAFDEQNVSRRLESTVGSWVLTSSLLYRSQRRASRSRKLVALSKSSTRMTRRRFVMATTIEGLQSHTNDTRPRAFIQLNYPISISR